MPDTTSRDVEELLSGLNEPQREAVTYGDGPLLILAGAGSGKTRVLTHRIAWLVRMDRARAGELLAITFTNKAAAEMRDRVELLLGRSVRGMWVMTFHSACARMLRADAQRLGYTRSFTIYDQADSRRLVRQCLSDLDVDPKRFPPAAVQNQISDAKNRLRAAEDYRRLVGSYFEQTVADVYELYEREIHRANAMDFDDLLFRAVNVLELFPEVRDRYQAAFRHVLVDEYQDTNHAQYRLLQLLTGVRTGDEPEQGHRNITVVGDDDQCLLEGTQVTMADGYLRAIEDVVVGDEVLSCHGSGDFRPARVTATHVGEERFGVAITTSSGRRIVSTLEHTHFAGFRQGLSPQAHLVLTVTLCGDRRGARPMHTIAVGGRDDEVRDALAGIGLDLRPSGECEWRYETCRADYGEVMSTAQRISETVPVHIRRLARFGKRVGGRAIRNSLPFIPASSVRPGMVMFTEDGGYDVVEEVEKVALERPVYDINVEGTHNLIAEGLLTHNSIYGFRGADIRNVLDFEDDYGDAHVVRLEQNYRSTQTILDAANSVISHNRGRKGKTLFTELGQGDPVKVRELDDEHAEARFVAGEVQRLVDEGVSREEIAVFYRTNAQSRVLEDRLIREEVAYQVIGGTKFYDRAEIKDAIAYLTILVNPQDTGSFSRVVNTPRRGVGQTSLSRVVSYANTLGEPVFDVAMRPEEVPSLGAAAVKALTRFMETMTALRQHAEAGAGVAEILEDVLEQTGYIEALEAERTIEAQGRIENLQELVEVAKEYDSTIEEATLEGFLQQIALLSDADSIRDEEGLLTLMTLHNAKGLEFPIVFIIGCEDGVFPHSRALDEGGLEEERRLCYVGITRAMRDLYLTYARTRNVFGARTYGLRSRFLDEIRSDLTDAESQVRVGVGAGPVRAAQTTWAAVRSDDAPAPEFRLGDDVTHAAFGEGVVTGVEPGGIVVVRFAGDGSERKLMAAYAPISKR